MKNNTFKALFKKIKNKCIWFMNRNKTIELLPKGRAYFMYQDILAEEHGQQYVDNLTAEEKFDGFEKWWETYQEELAKSFR